VSAVMGRPCRRRQRHLSLTGRKIPICPKVLGRFASTVENDIETQILHHDRIFVVAGLHSRWSTRRKIDLTELATNPGVFHHRILLPPLSFGELPVPTWPLGVMTLKNRTISPVVQVFLDYVREAVKPFLDRNNAENRLGGDA
jgi:hypothetical protein